MNAIILPIVIIGKCIVVGVGSIVNKEIFDYAIVVGNTARIIGDVEKHNWKTHD